jgi:SPP1 family predicted phage head-tail adaptor
MHCKKKIVLDRSITIQQYTDTKDAIGGHKMTWATLATVYANVDFIRGKEGEIVTKETATTKVDFRIRHRNDLNTKHRILYNSKYYDIKTILDDQDNQWLILKTEEVE